MKLRYQMRGLGIGIMVTALLMGVATDNKIPLSDAEIKMRALELGMVESDSLKLSDIPKVAVDSSGESEPLPPGDGGTMLEDGSGASEPGEDSGVEDSAAGGEPGSGNEGGAAGDSDAGNEGVAAGESDAGNEGGAAGESDGGNEGGATGESDAGNEGSAAGGSDAGNEGGGGTRESGAGNEGGASGREMSSENEGSMTGGDSVPVIIESGATSYSVCRQLEQLGLVDDAEGFDEYLCGMGYSRSVLEGTFYIAPGTSPEEIAKIITGKK